LLIKYGASIDKALNFVLEEHLVKGIFTPIAACILSKGYYLVPLIKHILYQGGIGDLLKSLTEYCSIGGLNKDWLRKNNLPVNTEINSLTPLQLATKSFYKDQEIARLIANIITICKDDTILYSPLYRAILLNDKEGIERFFDGKDASFIFAVYRNEIKVSEAKGYNVYELANKLEYPEIEQCLREIGNKAIERLKKNALSKPEGVKEIVI
jgi:hypothetical protein